MQQWEAYKFTLRLYNLKILQGNGAVQLTGRSLAWFCKLTNIQIRCLDLVLKIHGFNMFLYWLQLIRNPV